MELEFKRMSTKPAAPPLPTPTPGDLAKDEWEKKFFEKHGITDEDEKKAIRGRARVLAYDRARQAAEAEENKPPDNKPKPWYKD
jgi:hypothetical protein